MRILVLDTIHGGTVIGQALKKMGHSVNLVDVYRGDCSSQGSISSHEAAGREYDLIIHPVHLDPEYVLLRSVTSPAITHHEAVRWILGKKGGEYKRTGISVEITGTRGKTTTASALATIMQGTGILHTSRGTFRYPGEEFLTRMSITPASLVSVDNFLTPDDWMIAEISLGFSGTSDLAILTSDEDYLVAGGKMSAREVKRQSGLRCNRILVPPGMSYVHDSLIDAGDLVQITGNTCSYAYQGIEGSYTSPLLSLAGYRVPLQLATAAALLLQIRPDDLKNFSPLAGRMKIIQEGEKTIIDNASTGACLKTTHDAIALLQKNEEQTPFTLIIGQESRAVCENFSDEDIITAIKNGNPATVLLVAGDDRIDREQIIQACQKRDIPATIVSTMQEGVDVALAGSAPNIVISVKTWR